MGWHSFAATDFLGDYVSRGHGFIDAPLAACCERESINPPGTMGKRNADAYWKPGKLGQLA
jgi:hypothetical protein